MVLTLACGLPAAGLTFALSMFLGAGLTLAAVAVIVARIWLVATVTSHGASIERLSRLLEGLTRAMLVAIGIEELWS